MLLHIPRYLWNSLLVFASFGMASVAWRVLPDLWSRDVIDACVVGVSMVSMVCTWWEHRS